MERVDKQANRKMTSKTLLKKAAVSLKMRDFKKSKTSALLALSSAMNPTSKQKSELEAIVKEIDQETAVWPLSNDTRQFCNLLCDGIKAGDILIDTKIVYSRGSFANLNSLQYSALFPDLRGVEILVSLGASIDMPAFDENTSIDTSLNSGGPAPRSSALVLCCMALTLAKTMGTNAKFFAETVEISIRLVRLGANVHAVLKPMSGVDPSLQKLFGKSAFELAKISKEKRLIATMKHFYNINTVIDEIECRCGSRMPWVECHAGDGTTAFGQYNEKTGKPIWRLSPLAFCPCKSTTKKYYYCCWDSSTEYFKDDDIGTVSRTVIFSNKSGRLMTELVDSIENRAGVPNFDLINLRTWPQGQHGRSADSAELVEELRSKQVAFFRSKGRLALQYLASTNQKSKIGQWDPEVYAGTIERIHGTTFYWEDVHWSLPKAEILVRVGEWNDAFAEILRRCRLARRRAYRCR